MDPDTEILVQWEDGRTTQHLLADPILRLHPPSTCEGRTTPCCIHRPSDHSMKDWMRKLRYDMDFPLCERVCEHGISHPDPDSLSHYMNRLTPARVDTLQRQYRSCPQCRPRMSPAEVEAWYERMREIINDRARAVTHRAAPTNFADTVTWNVTVRPETERVIEIDWGD